MPGFEVVLYPRETMTKKLRRMMKKHPIPYAVFHGHIEAILNPQSGESRYNELCDQEIISSLGKKCKDGSLWEIRCPKTLSGGVLRVYFCKTKNRSNKIVLLDAEFKTEKEANTEEACRRLTEYRQTE
jgi:hypothetical protein